MNKKFFVMGIALVATITLTGCGKSLVEKKIEKNIQKEIGKDFNVDVDGDGDTIKIVGEDGSVVQGGENVQLPKDFPKDVYIIDGELLAVVENLGMVGYNVAINTDKVTEDIDEEYQDKITKDGWTIDSNMNVPGMLMINAKKGNRTLTIAATPNEDEDGKNVVSVTVVKN